MAKLSARGGTIVIQGQKETSTPGGDLTIWHRNTLAVRREASGTLRFLTKYDVRFKPDRVEPNGQYHSYGWKEGKKLKPGVTMDEIRDVLTKAGYVIMFQNGLVATK